MGGGVFELEGTHKKKKKTPPCKQMLLLTIWRLSGSLPAAIHLTQQFLSKEQTFKKKIK